MARPKCSLWAPNTDFHTPVNWSILLAHSARRTNSVVTGTRSCQAFSILQSSKKQLKNFQLKFLVRWWEEKLGSYGNHSHSKIRLTWMSLTTTTNWFYPKNLIRHKNDQNEQLKCGSNGQWRTLHQLLITFGRRFSSPYLQIFWTLFSQSSAFSWNSNFLKTKIITCNFREIERILDFT